MYFLEFTFFHLLLALFAGLFFVVAFTSILRAVTGGIRDRRAHRRATREDKLINPQDYPERWGHEEFDDSRTNEIDQPYRVIKWVSVSPDQYTHLLKPLLENYQRNEIVRLQIVKFENDPGVYLLYLNVGGGILIDNYFETIEAAEEMAGREYFFPADSWKLVDTISV